MSYMPPAETTTSTPLSSPRHWMSSALCAVIGATCFFLVSSFRERGFGDDSVDWQVGLRLVMLALSLGLSAFCYKLWIGKLFKLDNVMIIPLLVMIAASSLYAPSPVFSGGTAFSFISLFAVMFAGCAVAGERRVIMTLVSTCSFISLVSTVVFFVATDYGHSKEWIGDVLVPTNRLSGITGANGAGMIAATGILFAAIARTNYRTVSGRFLLLCVIINLCTLALSESRTAMFAVAAALLFLFFARLSMQRMAILFIGFSATLCIGVFVNIDTLFSMISRSGEASEITSGTGRVYIWNIALELIAQRPFFGWGYGSSSFVLPSHALEIGHIPPHCHNAFLQIAFSIGWVGLGVFVMLMLGKLIGTAKAYDIGKLSLFVFVLMAGLTEATAFSGLANFATAVYAYIFAASSMTADKLRS